MNKTNGLEESVHVALEKYFKDLDGEQPAAIYDMVMKCVEKPMLRCVLNRAQTQCDAARMLGISRNTLRKKLNEYGL